MKRKPFGVRCLYKPFSANLVIEKYQYIDLKDYASKK